MKAKPRDYGILATIASYFQSESKRAAQISAAGPSGPIRHCNLQRTCTYEMTTLFEYVIRIKDRSRAGDSRSPLEGGNARPAQKGKVFE